MTTAVAEIEDGLSTLAGTGKLLRFQLRRSRMFLFWWIVGLAGGTWALTPAMIDQYQDPAAREAFATTMDTPAMRSMSGPVDYINAYGDSLGALFAHRMLLWTGAMTAVMFILLVTRLTRADEETSRSEVFRSNPIGRRADLAAALLLSTAAALALGALMSLAVLGLEDGAADGALLYGLAHTAIALVFASLTAVAAQISEFASAANGYGFALLGWAVLIAGVGNAQENAATWLSPIGWSELTYAYTPEQRWWPLLIALAVAAAGVWLAFTLVAHRDFGQGMVAAKTGRPDGTLSGIQSLTFRLTRGLLWSGVITLLLLGAAYGSVLVDSDEFVENLSEAQQQILLSTGSDPADGFTATFVGVNALVAGIFGLLVIGRARKEETVGRGELLAAAPITRAGWPGSYLPVAMLAVTVTNLLSGLALAASGSGGDGDLFGKVVLAAAVRLPAVWVLTAFAFAAFTWLPRAGWLRWLAWIWMFVALYFGQMLDLPNWVLGISPLYHVGGYPVDDVDWVSVGVLTAIAAAFTALGYLGARRRDLHFS